MNRTVGKWLSALGLVALMVLCPMCHREPIEQHLKAESSAALVRAGLPEWAKNVSFSGFDATLFGPRDQAKQAGSVVRGVLSSQVPWLADIKLLGKKEPNTDASPASEASPSAEPSASPEASPTPEPSASPAAPSPAPTARPTALAAGEPTGLVQVLSYEDKVYVRGVYPDDTSRQSAVQAAKAAFGAGAVRDETTLSGKGGTLGWPEETLKSLSALKSVRGLELSAGGDLVTLTGQVGSAAERERLGGIVKASLPATVTLENRLTLAGEKLSTLAPTASAALPEAERKSAQQTLNGVVGSGQVLFATASSRIRPEAYPYLDTISETLKSQTAATIVVGGHTDNQGEESGNRQLSQKRADSVRSYLIARGVPARHLFAQGFGSSQPVANNNSEEGRRRNRRIGFVVR